jgi:hypothetical protein
MNPFDVVILIQGNTCNTVQIAMITYVARGTKSCNASTRLLRTQSGHWKPTGAGIMQSVQMLFPQRWHRM